MMWRGVECSDDAAWLERGQVFSALTKLSTTNELLLPVDNIKLRYAGWKVLHYQAATKSSAMLSANENPV